MYESMLNYPNNLFGQFERLRRELDDAFGASGLPSSIRSVASGTSPAINVGTTPTSVEIYAFAPGLDASRIEVTLDRGVLRISGERAPDIPRDNPKVNVYTRERGTGSFTRALALPDDVDPARVKASYRDGIVQVSVARHSRRTHHERQQTNGPDRGPGTAARGVAGRGRIRERIRHYGAGRHARRFQGQAGVEG